MKWTTKRLQSHIRKSISSLRNGVSVHSRIKYFALSHLPQFIFVFNSGAQLSPKSLWTAFTVLYIWDDDNRIYKSSVHQTCSLSLSITNTLFRRITRILLPMGKLNSKRSYDDCCCVIFSTSKVWLPSKNAWLRFPPFALRVMEPWGCVCVCVCAFSEISFGWPFFARIVWLRRKRPSLLIFAGKVFAFRCSFWPWETSVSSRKQRKIN